MMVWIILGTIAFVIVVVAAQMAFDVTAAWLFARGIWRFADAMENNGTDDPVYKKNLQRLINRNREFEEARKSKG